MERSNSYKSKEVRGTEFRVGTICLEGGINLYAYVTGNPINLGDLYGLDAGVITIPLALIAFFKAAAFAGSAVIAADLINDLIHMMNSESSKDKQCEGTNEPSDGTSPDGDDPESTKENRDRQKGDRWTSDDDPLQQLDEIEKAQQNVRKGKLKKAIDSIEKSKQRVKQRLDRIKNIEDILDWED